MKFRLILWFAVALLGASSYAEAATVTWYKTATQYRNQYGRTITMYCPPSTTRSGSVYGTGFYTADSRVCKAAVHAGKIGWGGGTIRIKMNQGRSSYYGSYKHGVSSKTWRRYYNTSFFFLTVRGGGVVKPPHRGGGMRITWYTNATSYRHRINQRFTFYCPPGNSSKAVYGTGFYTTDSGICRAAVHAGRIGFSGGRVKILIKPGRSAYYGMYKNGIKSRSWKRFFANSFIFMR